jgi:aerobic carbon-monoxide dehydrogenase large subunit
LFHTARVLGRPVKWTDERSESFISDSHGRDHEMTAELALDAEGNFLAVRVSGYGNLGAYVGRGAAGPPTANAVKNTIGVYRTPLIEVSTKLVVTNTPPVGAYRGAGRPEGNYYMERLVDTAAAEMGAFASSPTAMSRSSPARSITARVTGRRSRRSCISSSASRSTASGYCKATATN